MKLVSEIVPIDCSVIAPLCLTDAVTLPSWLMVTFSALAGTVMPLTW